MGKPDCHEPAVQNAWLHYMHSDYAVGAWSFLNGSYAAKYRTFHNWCHIDAMSEDLEVVTEQAAKPRLIEHAVLWHDAVFATRNRDGSLRLERENVAASVKLFQNYARMATQHVAAISELVMATADHFKPFTGIVPYKGFIDDRLIILDLDLAVLSTPPSIYDDYARNVRAEYGWVADSDYIPGRRNALEFLDRQPALYRSQAFIGLFSEDDARANIRRELLMLSRQTVLEPA